MKCRYREVEQQMIIDGSLYNVFTDIHLLYLRPTKYYPAEQSSARPAADAGHNSFITRNDFYDRQRV